MIYILAFVVFLGLIIGSFLNVIIYRLHARETLAGRSKCTNCKVVIAWYDNFPVISFILLGGKCRRCKHRISAYYPFVESITALLFAFAFLAFQPYANLVNYIELMIIWMFIAVLIIIFVYDLKWYLILDVVTVPAMAFAFVANIWLGHTWWKLLLAGILGGGFFLAQFLISRGRWIGGGDIRLGTLMGFMLGLPMIGVAMMLAYLIGTIVTLPLVFLGNKKMGDKIPFGTFLAFATVLTLLAGDKILAYYLSLF